MRVRTINAYYHDEDFYVRTGDSAKGSRLKGREQVLAKSPLFLRVFWCLCVCVCVCVCVSACNVCERMFPVYLCRDSSVCHLFF